MKKELLKLIGTLPNEGCFKARMRFHQGWWRAFVLAEEQGSRPGNKEDVVCNTIFGGEKSKKNFLSANILSAAEQTIFDRRLVRSGIIEENRLYNNLLSSQPLCFNFFGELKTNKDLALAVLKQFWPEITLVNNVIFEFAPKEKYTNDNSAFDVAFEVMADNLSGLIGLECKYTDTFSPKEYDNKKYRQIFSADEKKTFLADYHQFIAARFNQLFRNQLLAESLFQNHHYDFVLTGLFCHQKDESALETGKEFQHMLVGGDKTFKVITYHDFIEKMQLLNIGWELRELSMLLWARYCATGLSQQVFK